MLSRRTMVTGAAMLGATSAKGASQAVRLGVLNDRSGPYKDLSGETSVACVRQAIRDAGDRGFAVEVVTADHQNNAEVAGQIARSWLDRGDVDAVVDVPNSAVALNVSSIVRARNKVLLNCSTGTTELTGGQCSPNTVHWSWDTYMLAKALAGPVTRAGCKRWFFIAANYATGRQLAEDGGRFAVEAGGRVLGTAIYPFPETTDFSAYLLQAQASGADVLGLGNGGNDTSSNIKQAAELGLTARMRIAAFVMQLSDVRAVGLEDAKGLLLVESFYWDLDGRSRALVARIRPMGAGNMPSTSHASAYGATLHYPNGRSRHGTGGGQGRLEGGLGPDEGHADR